MYIWRTTCLQFKFGIFLVNTQLNPAILNSQGKRKIVQNTHQKFEIVDSKWVKGKSKWNGFDFKIAEFELAGSNCNLNYNTKQMNVISINHTYLSHPVFWGKKSKQNFSLHVNHKLTKNPILINGTARILFLTPKIRKLIVMSIYNNYLSLLCTLYLYVKLMY